MYKVCKTEQSAARQRELENHLLKEMLSKDYGDISISDLCDGCGIPRKAFYRYFSGKHGALHALIDHTLMDLDGYTVEISQSEPFDQRRFLSSFFRFWKEHKMLLDAVERSGLWGELMECTVEYASSEMARMNRYSLQSVQVERSYQNRFVIFGIMAILQEWYRRGFPQTEGQLAAIAAAGTAQLAVYWKKV